MSDREIIVIDKLKRNFVVGDETVHALREISFTIREGEFVTIMGNQHCSTSSDASTFQPRATICSTAYRCRK